MVFQQATILLVHNHLANPLNHQPLLATKIQLELLLLFRAFLPKLHSMDWANRCSLSRLAICPVCLPPHTSLLSTSTLTEEWILSRFAAVMIGREQLSLNYCQSHAHVMACYYVLRSVESFG